MKTEVCTRHRENGLVLEVKTDFRKVKSRGQSVIVSKSQKGPGYD